MTLQRFTLRVQRSRSALKQPGKETTHTIEAMTLGEAMRVVVMLHGLRNVQSITEDATGEEWSPLEIERFLVLKVPDVAALTASLNSSEYVE